MRESLLRAESPLELPKLKNREGERATAAMRARGVGTSWGMAETVLDLWRSRKRDEEEGNVPQLSMCVCTPRTPKDLPV